MFTMVPPFTFKRGITTFEMRKAPRKLRLIISSNSLVVVFSIEVRPCIKPAKLTNPDNEPTR